MTTATTATTTTKKKHSQARTGRERIVDAETQRELESQVRQVRPGRAPLAKLCLELGDANANGKIDLSVRLTVGGRELAPAVVRDLPEGPALAAMSAMFNAAEELSTFDPADLVGIVKGIANSVGGFKLLTDFIGKLPLGRG